MNKTHTLKELADIGAKAANSKLPTGSYQMTVGITYNYADHDEARAAFTKAILDAIGYEFPKNKEREAFDAWCAANHKLGTTDQFEAWKAGREELLKTQALAKESDTKTEPAWIPWPGGDKSPIAGTRPRFEIEFRNGKRHVCNENYSLYWPHHGTARDIVAYRILEP